MPTKKRLTEAQKIAIDAVLADSVATPGDGKVYVQGGGWNVLTTSTLPVRHSRLGLAIFFRVPYALANNMPRNFHLSLLDSDGNKIRLGEVPDPTTGGVKPLTVLTGTFTVGRPHVVQPGDEQLLAIGLNLDGLVFDKQGAYVFTLDADDAIPKQLRFRVNHFAQVPMIQMA